MFNPANAGKPKDAERTKSIAQGLGLRIQSQEVLEPADFERAFAAFEREHAQALIVLDETFTTLHAKRIAELALKYQLPTMHSFSESVVAGGLISYGPSGAQMVEIATTYVDKILKGAKPADLAVQQPTKFEMFVNRKTAKALGVTIPNSILLRADKVIE
jgi:putative tryptophan/tyrosine transport system substrate-binding protein